MFDLVNSIKTITLLKSTNKKEHRDRSCFLDVKGSYDVLLR